MVPAMTTAQSKLIASVQERFGPRAAATDVQEIEPWLSDWRGKFHGKAAAILQPGSTEEVAEIVSLAADLGVPLVPQGGNTGMVGGATPPEDGSALVLSLRRMNRLRSISLQRPCQKLLFWPFIIPKGIIPCNSRIMRSGL